MVGLLQDLDLPVGPLRIGRVLECVEYFLKCVHFLRDSVLDLPNVAVRPRPYLFEDVEFFEHMILYLTTLRFHQLSNYICYSN